jgi:hypothetical protein
MFIHHMHVYFRSLKTFFKLFYKNIQYSDDTFFLLFLSVYNYLGKILLL